MSETIRLRLAEFVATLALAQDNAFGQPLDIDAIGERFRPWRTLAALYLYRSGSR